jgi:hypothetical protein
MKYEKTSIQLEPGLMDQLVDYYKGVTKSEIVRFAVHYLNQRRPSIKPKIEFIEKEK